MEHLEPRLYLAMIKKKRERERAKKIETVERSKKSNTTGDRSKILNTTHHLSFEIWSS